MASVHLPRGFTGRVGMTARSRSVVYLDELRAGDDHVVR